mmetsp:Transcript_31263/g.42339  ORF Transcript_31263/g.42339 Transcript_31263/m.42339 type:complete len:367 (+) Transcript_31263:322-1422(+)
MPCCTDDAPLFTSPCCHVIEQRVRCLDTRHESTLLAETLRTVFALPKPYPVSRTLHVRNSVLPRAIQLGPLHERTRCEPGYGPGKLSDPAVYGHRLLKLGHSGRQQFVEEQPLEVFLPQTKEGAGVVKVARKNTPLGTTPRSRGLLGGCFLPPQRSLLCSRCALQLIQHEKRATRALQLREAGKDVRRRASGHDPVKPQPHRYHVDALVRGSRSQRGLGRQQRTAPHHGFHALGAQREHNTGCVIDAPVCSSGLQVLVLDGTSPLRLFGARNLLLLIIIIPLATTLKHLGDRAAAQHGEGAIIEEVGSQRCDEAGGDGACLDPAHVKRVLVGEGVVIEQLHGHQCGELVRWLEEAHEQRRRDEVGH